MKESPHKDPVVELYKRDIDASLLRENLKLTHEERLLKHDRMLEAVLELREAGKKMRRGRRE